MTYAKISTMFDFIVVGAGITGCVLAERIATRLKKKVLIIEKRNHIGGNCYDYVDSNTGIIVHKYGPHIFHTDYREVFEYLSNFTDWDVYIHKVIAVIDGKRIPLPFNFKSIDMVFPQHMAHRIKEKLINTYGFGKKVSILELKQSSDADLILLADYVYNKVFLNYTSKQWNKKPEEIDHSVTARVPVYTSYQEGYFTDKYQALPSHGYTKMIERIIDNPNIKLLLNTDFRELIKVDLETKQIYFMGLPFKGILIFTGMIDELFDYKFGLLPYRTLRFVSKIYDVEYFQEVAVVNYPNNFDFTRITEYKHMHKPEYHTGRTIVVYEYPDEYKKGDIPYYPVFTQESQEAYLRYRELAEEFDNLILAGRLAEYRYYDMDDAVKRALEIFEEKLS